jgi:hypothetical protein
LLVQEPTVVQIGSKDRLIIQRIQFHVGLASRNKTNVLEKSSTYDLESQEGEPVEQQHGRGERSKIIITILELRSGSERDTATAARMDTRVSTGVASPLQIFGKIANQIRDLHDFHESRAGVGGQQQRGGGSRIHDL